MSEFDDLSVGLARAAGKPWFSRTTLILGGLVLLVAGFLVGLQVSPASATTPTSFNRGNLNGYLPGAEGFPGGFQGRNGGGTGANSGTGTGRQAQATTGKIKLVDGNTVYVEMADGSIVTVKVTDTTRVATSASVKDLKAGASVTVQGQADADGNITAGSITQTK
jgi:Cu/Ag efflux protein CusF